MQRILAPVEISFFKWKIQFPNSIRSYVSYELLNQHKFFACSYSTNAFHSDSCLFYKLCHLSFSSWKFEKTLLKLQTLCKDDFNQMVAKIAIRWKILAQYASNRYYELQRYPWTYAMNRVDHKTYDQVFLTAWSIWRKKGKLMLKFQRRRQTA